MYICVYVYIHICVYIYKYIYIHIHTFTRMYMYTMFIHNTLCAHSSFIKLVKRFHPLWMDWYTMLQGFRLTCLIEHTSQLLPVALQYTATRCNTLQHAATQGRRFEYLHEHTSQLLPVALQYTATRCNTRKTVWISTWRHLPASSRLAPLHTHTRKHTHVDTDTVAYTYTLAVCTVKAVRLICTVIVYKYICICT